MDIGNERSYKILYGARFWFAASSKTIIKELWMETFVLKKILKILKKISSKKRRDVQSKYTVFSFKSLLRLLNYKINILFSVGYQKFRMSSNLSWLSLSTLS